MKNLSKQVIFEVKHVFLSCALFELHFGFMTVISADLMAQRLTGLGSSVVSACADLAQGYGIHLC